MTEEQIDEVVQLCGDLILRELSGVNMDSVGDSCQAIEEILKVGFGLWGDDFV